jgi:hypothetical protein
MLPKRQLPSEPRSVPIAEFREFPRINLLEWMNDYSAHQHQLLPNRSGAALERMWLHEVFRGINRRQKMKRLAVTTALATVFASYAFAQATTEYYVQDTTTKKCTIVDKKPTTTTVTQVGPVAFKTRQEAETGMKTIKVCETK